MITHLMHNQRLIGVFTLLLGLVVLIVPVTYYDYIDYIIRNSVSQIGQDNISLELKNAAIHLYNGHPIKQINAWVLFVMGLAGAILLYISTFLLFNRAEKIKKLFSIQYWQEFTLLP